ncbi:MAG TPA: PmoA family protein [Aggregatilineales bacterium]|nr:PmoA family protein [Aggregatilineales bacterium]
MGRAVRVVSEGSSLHLYSERADRFGPDGLMLTYQTAPPMPAVHAPRPYIHPLYSPRGVLLTEDAPPDHPWHRGLSMTFVDVSGVNFWGGHTYLQDHGYVLLANHGRVDLLNQTVRLQGEGSGAAFHETWAWRNATGDVLLTEARRWEVSIPLLDQPILVITIFSRFTNSTAHPLRFGSPWTQGRAGVGYGGLFWRLPAALTGGTFNAQSEAEVLSAPDPYGVDKMHYHLAGRLDLHWEARQFLPEQIRATAWFVRQKDYLGICAAFPYERHYDLLPRERLYFWHTLSMSDVYCSTLTG